MTFRTLSIFVSFLILAPRQSLGSQGKPGYSGFDLVDTTGNIRKPLDYRDHYQALGTFTVLDPKGDQMHYTYASPGT